jgi:hypothetical protein
VNAPQNGSKPTSANMARIAVVAAANAEASRHAAAVVKASSESVKSLIELISPRSLGVNNNNQ